MSDIRCSGSYDERGHPPYGHDCRQWDSDHPIIPTPLVACPHGCALAEFGTHADDCPAAGPDTEEGQQ